MRHTSKTAAKAGAMTGGMAIVEALIANRVETVFGLPGAQLYPLFDALEQRSDRIRTIGARHEQACGYMAFGYARSTGRPGVFAVVPGPGVLNTSAALATAYGCCAPVLCITGQVPAAFLGRGRGHLHELPDQLADVALADEVGGAHRAPGGCPAGHQRGVSPDAGRPAGPGGGRDGVGHDGVERIRRAAAGRRDTGGRCAFAARGRGSRQAARRRRAADDHDRQRGAACGEAVLALAEELGAPVAAFRGGRGVVAEDHELGVSSYAAYRLWPQTDALVGIGSRLEMPYMRWSGMMRCSTGRKRRPISSASISTRRRCDVWCRTPASWRTRKPERARCWRPCGACAAARARQGWDNCAGEARARIAAVKSEVRTAFEKVQPQLAYLDVIREVLPRDGIFVTELSQVGFTSYFGYPVYTPRSYVSEGYQGTLGFGFPTALGVKVAHPDTPVVSITGDGGFMFAVQELATAEQYGIALVTLVFNNSAYGNVLRDQRTAFGNRVIGAALDNPDFMLLAKSFGIEGHRVNSPAALKRVLEKAMGSSAPVLIEVEVPQGQEVSPWEFIHPKVHPNRL